MGATDPREIIVANSQFGSGAISGVAPATWYLALSTTTPNDSGTNFTEPVGGSYQRVAITNNSTNFPAPEVINGVTVKKNGAPFTFPNPTGNWGLIVAYGFFEVISGGTVQYWNPIDTPITIQSGNTPVQFATGQLGMPWN